MKKLFKMSLMAIVCVMCGVSTVSAASWRVNNNTASAADFVDVNAAMNDERVAEGDTLYLDPSTIFTTEQTISKRVTIVGPGYLHRGVAAAPAVFGNYVNITAHGTKIEGCTFNTRDVRMKANNITIERCYFSSARIISSSTRSNNSVIHANFFYGNSYIKGSYSGSDYDIPERYYFQGWTVTNNIIYDPSTSNNVCIEYLNNATIKNNICIINGNYYKSIETVYNSVITNNILLNTKSAKYALVNFSSDVAMNTIENNVLGCAATDFPDYPNNTFLNTTDLSTVFVNTGLAEDKFRLCEGSPAIGAGENGIDCGAYAGDSYVPSGLPLFYPYFTGVEIPAVTTDGKLNIKLNIKTQNE